MSGRKIVAHPFPWVINGDMSANITSSAQNIAYTDNVGIQLNFTGASPTGDFFVDVSQDHVEANGVIKTAGNWIALTLSPAPAASGSAGNIYIDLNQLSAPYIRVRFVASSSVGTLNAFITAKMV